MSTFDKLLFRKAAIVVYIDLEWRQQNVPFGDLLKGKWREICNPLVCALS